MPSHPRSRCDPVALASTRSQPSARTWPSPAARPCHGRSFGYKSLSLGAPSALPSPGHHLWPSTRPPSTRAEGRRRTKRAKPLPRGRPGDHRSWSGQHCMARLPELHDLDSSLHRYPLALNTDTEPYAAETSSKPHGHQSRALARRARNTTNVAWPPPARALDHWPEHQTTG